MIHSQTVLQMRREEFLGKDEVGTVLKRKEMQAIGFSLITFKSCNIKT